jgi:hypothetical protein
VTAGILFGVDKFASRFSPWIKNTLDLIPEKIDELPK